MDNDVLMGISHARYLGISDNEIVKIFKEGLKDGITPQSVNQTLRTMLLTPGQLKKFAEYDINPKEYEYRQLCELKKLVDSGVSKDTLSEIADPDNPADKMEKMGKLALYEQNTLNEQNDIGQKSDLEYTMTFAGNDISDDHDDI